MGLAGAETGTRLDMNWTGSVKRIVLLARLLSLTYCRTVLHMVRCTAASWS